MASPLDRPDVATLLAGTPWAEVAVETGRGPHITPAAFAAADGRLWVVSSRRTVRVRSVRRRHRAAVLVRRGERAVVVSGSADVLALGRLGETVGLVMNSLPAARAAAGYTLRNASLVIGGFLRDILAGTGDLTVYDRVLVAIEPGRGMLLDGDRLLDSWGRWRRVSRPMPPRALQPVPALDDLLDRLPPAVSGALDRPETASLGWSTPSGPLALPTLDAHPDGRFVVASAALELAGAPARSAACATFHDSESPRPSGFRGVILRGEAHTVRRGQARTSLALDVERVSWWSGFRAGTVQGESSAPPRVASPAA